MILSYPGTEPVGTASTGTPTGPVAAVMPVSGPLPPSYSSPTVTRTSVPLIVETVQPPANRPTLPPLPPPEILGGPGSPFVPPIPPPPPPTPGTCATCVTKAQPPITEGAPTAAPGPSPVASPAPKGAPALPPVSSWPWWVWVLIGAGVVVVVKHGR